MVNASAKEKKKSLIDEHISGKHEILNVLSKNSNALICTKHLFELYIKTALTYLHNLYLKSMTSKQLLREEMALEGAD